MFFVLSKTAGFLAVPSNLIVIVGLFGLVLMPTRFSRAGRRLLATGFVFLVVAGVTPLGRVLLLPLEQRFPAWDDTRGAPDGIVVLGGAVNPELSAARGQVSLNESAERLTEVAALARRYPAARIVFAGGNASLIPGGLPEASVVRQLFESFGIAPARLAIEDRSRNTAENAAFARDVAAPKPGERWLLVTSAAHMPRAVGTFRKAGFGVEAYPVDWQMRGAQDLYVLSNPLLGGLKWVDNAVHEWVGLLAYWISGRSDELFPRPSATSVRTGSG